MPPVNHSSLPKLTDADSTVSVHREHPSAGETNGNLLEQAQQQGVLLSESSVGNGNTGSGNLVSRATQWLKVAGDSTLKTITLPKAFVPMARLFTHNHAIDEQELAHALDVIFSSLSAHPVTKGSRRFTDFLRNNSILPNEHTTEDLIRFVVNQSVARSPMPVPDTVLTEFWTFFDELLNTPELKGLAEVNLEASRFILKTYEPLLLELINNIKETRQFNAEKLTQITKRTAVLREDIVIIQRQIRALRYIKPFFEADPKDFALQAEIVAKMVGEFGPFFVKLAQAAAANSDFLPDEISQELEKFQENVPPMTADEVTAAFIDAYGKPPHEIYFGFDVNEPLKSGSIGSVYLARKPVFRNGPAGMREELEKVIVKVGRYNLDREFMMGRMVLGLAIISSQYWAPHGKLEPFLRALQHQVEEFVHGFEQELDFELEAQIQKRFAARGEKTNAWHVPQVHRASPRILEMDYLENARSLASLNHNRSIFTAGWSRKRQRRVAQKLIYTIMQHAVVYQEIHGDLHPGNIMVDDDGELHLIDWGNAINLQGKWRPVWQYVSAALAADSELLADALIEMSTDRLANQARRDDIVDLLKETLRKRNIQPLGRRFYVQLAREGLPGLQKRLHAVAQMMSNTQQLDLVVRSEYMHLSRSLFAALGSYLSLYSGQPMRAISDLLAGVALFPVNYLRDQAAVKWQSRADQVIYALPMPEIVRRRLAYKPPQQPQAPVVRVLDDH